MCHSRPSKATRATRCFSTSEIRNPTPEVRSRWSRLCRSSNFGFRTPLAFILAALPFLASGADIEVDLSKLPPPATTTVDFERDIRPIFERSCIRCHGSEKPKSHFQLIDRNSALKGGNENTDDIVPGDSAHSRLVHYVAGLVEDMQMPPPGKGEPLSAAEVGLVRAWIDQGAAWSPAAQYPQSTYFATPLFRWVGVNGDSAKFRELTGMSEGFGGGIEHFSVGQRDAPDRSFLAEGHFLFPDKDYQLKLQWTKTDYGFVRAGFDRWRRYYDDTGGFAPGLAGGSADLDRDLHMDIGRAWMDIGLTLPDWPKIVLGYEYQFQNGAKSVLEWGDVNGADPTSRTVFPAAKQIDESAHVLKLDVSHEIAGWFVEDNARAEFFDSKTSTDTVKNQLVLGPPDGAIQTREGFGHTQGQNTIRLERQVTDWMFVSSGYLYSHLDGDASFNQNTSDASGAPVTGLFWNSDEILLNRDAHIFSVAGTLQPLRTLNFALGFQGEWSRQDSMATVNFDEGDPGQQFTNRIIESHLDRQRYAEEASARFTRIPWTVLFAEARLEQERIGQFERQLGDEFLLDDFSFLRDTGYSNDRRDWRVGFSTSPWQFVALSAHFRNDLSTSDYNHHSDYFLDPSGGPLIDPTTGAPVGNPGYSAFIRHRTIDTDEVEAKLAVHPISWLKATLTYQLVSTDFTTGTDPVAGFDPSQGAVDPNFISPGGRIAAATHDAHVYGIGVTVTPIRRLYLSAAFTYSTTRTESARNGNLAVVPYDGDIYTVSGNVTYALSRTTVINASYSFSKAGYGQDNAADGLPLGLDYTQQRVTFGFNRKLGEHVTVGATYRFYDYQEPSTGGLNDFTAHGIFAVMGISML